MPGEPGMREERDTTRRRRHLPRPGPGVACPPMEANLGRYRIFTLATNAYFTAPVTFLYLLASFPLAEVVALEAIFQATSVLLEVPSGYLSDRLGRVGTLRLAALGFAASALVMGFGAGFQAMAVAQVLRALAFACQSGTDVSLHLGTLAALGREEELAAREERLAVLRLRASATAALLGGAAGLASMPAAFGLRALAGFAALAAAAGMREPPEERDAAREGFAAQLRACGGLLADPFLRWGAAAAVWTAVVDHLPYNFYQPYIDLLAGAGWAVVPPGTSTLVAGVHMAGVMGIGSLLAARSRAAHARLGFRRLVLVALGGELVLALAMGLVLHPAVLALLLLREGPHAFLRAPWAAAVVPRLPPARRATFLSLQALGGRLAIASLLAGLAALGGAAGSWPALATMLRVGVGVGALGWCVLAATGPAVVPGEGAAG